MNLSLYMSLQCHFAQKKSDLDRAQTTVVTGRSRRREEGEVMMRAKQGDVEIEEGGGDRGVVVVEQIYDLQKFLSSGQGGK